MREFSIGRLARAAGSAVQTVRWYEQQGLMPPPARTSGGQRRYDESALRRLLFIRHARDLGFSIADIRALLTLADSPAAPCAEADAIARRQLAATRRRIAELRLLERELARMVEE
ncbi:MAG TPA: MerR family transcriptional regulator, partial [Thermopetrobacter sp.]|nr:MerR family transcriptional regulator [Thermopetrobacter sp.]